MKIQRQIERRIELTAAEVYAAVAKEHDLPTDGVCAFENDDGTLRNQITLLNTHAWESEGGAK